MRSIVVLSCALALTGCAGSGPPGVAADPTSNGAWAPAYAGDYRIGTADVLAISVYQVPDLSMEEALIDATGGVSLPLIGTVAAAGLTTQELSRSIEEAYARQYLRDPRVNIRLVRSASQKVTVDGAVKKPGVYVMSGRTTLLQAVAMAEGVNRTGRLNRVAVFRTIDNRRAMAVFDISAIRQGLAADPVLQGEDVVVVDTSRLSQALQDVVSVLPGLAVFGYL